MKKIACLKVLLAATLWGSSGVFVTFLSRLYGLTGAQMTALRLVFVPVFLGILFLLTDKSQFHVDRKDVPLMAVNGLIGTFMFNICYTYAINLTGMAVAAVLIYLMPSLVMLFSVVFWHEPFTAKKGLCLSLSLIACALVSGIASSSISVNLLGVLLGIVSAFGYATYNIMVSGPLKKYSALTNTFYPFTFAAVLNLVYVAIKGELASGIAIYASHPGAILLTLALAMTCSILTYFLFNNAVKVIPGSLASIIATFEPAAAAIFGLVILNQPLVGSQWLGLVFEIIALVLIALPDKEASK